MMLGQTDIKPLKVLKRQALTYKAALVQPHRVHQSMHSQHSHSMHRLAMEREGREESVKLSSSGYSSNDSSYSSRIKQSLRFSPVMR